MAKTLAPNKTKFKKTFRVRTIRQIFSYKKSFFLLKDSFTLKAISFGLISSTQYIALKYILSKILKKKGTYNLNFFPNKAKSKRKDNGRMGKGKGNDKLFFFCIKPGFLICNIKTQIFSIGLNALKAAQKRLPFKTKIIY